MGDEDDNNHRSRTLTRPLMMRLKFFIGSFLFYRSDGTINRRLLDPKIPASPVSFSDISVDPSRDLWFRLFVPSHSQRLPLLVYFHGGGFSFFSPDSKPCHDLCLSLAAAVAPEHRCPSQYHDAFDALRFLNNEVLPPSIDLQRCFLAGI
ncbi:hypothetical protein SASPL_115325 [Salvia splendens]|uniref:Alpha/beta hydrolase fold-3 domain-containing protein n=1 Tax=Salvia splendens TaxID=180675 RepID=A0A8X9A167_SALSN|nr:hypothetical protein SASPL_115325 [Salvia splendens]